MSDLNKHQLESDKAILLVIDIQEKLVAAMPEKIYRRMRQTVSMLVEAAGHLNVPVLTTEQYPKGIGHTVNELSNACQHGTVVEKVSFGCCDEPSFVDALKASGRTQVIVTGMEAHVCVYLTVLGLLDKGYHVLLAKDAVCSRNKHDFLTGVEAARDAGAVVVTAEMILFQLLKHSTHPEFRQISKLIKGRS